MKTTHLGSQIGYGLRVAPAPLRLSPETRHSPCRQSYGWLPPIDDPKLGFGRGNLPRARLLSRYQAVWFVFQEDQHGFGSSLGH